MVVIVNVCTYLLNVKLGALGSIHLITVPIIYSSKENFDHLFVHNELITVVSALESPGDHFLKQKTSSL